jgi:hypothetical protein
MKILNIFGQSAEEFDEFDDEDECFYYLSIKLIA